MIETPLTREQAEALLAEPLARRPMPPRGMKRIVVAMNVPVDRDKVDVAIEVEGHFDYPGLGLVSDPTVWDSREDFVADWTEGLA